MPTTAQDAPTVDDARKAAAALVACAGVTQVWLYGSVQHGAARAASDIDLVAVLDDLDYARRFDVAARLNDVAERATGHRCDVFPTDLPEWEHRTTELAASYERDLRRGGAVLLAESPTSTTPRWGKEPDVARTDDSRDAAWRAMGDARAALWGALAQARPSHEELDLLDAGDNRRAEGARFLRAKCAVRDAAMTAENLVKAIRKLQDPPPTTRHTIHNVRQLLNDVEPELRGVIHARFAEAGVDPSWLPVVHKGASYAEEFVVAGWTKQQIFARADLLTSFACDFMVFANDFVAPHLADRYVGWQRHAEDTAYFIDRLKSVRERHTFGQPPYAETDNFPLPEQPTRRTDTRSDDIGR